MQRSSDSTTEPRRYWAFGQLVLARMREFYREPEALFWVYGFPLLMTLALGIAFRERPRERSRVDVVQGVGASQVAATLEQSNFEVFVRDSESCEQRLRTGRTDVVVRSDGRENPTYQLIVSASRPESLLARDQVNEALQLAAGRRDVVAVSTEELTVPGSRYIDFLVPGLLGMGIMGGGLWGVGFVTVDMRIRKLLKRFLATPMRRADFLAALIVSRMVFLVPEVAVLLLFSWLVFGVSIAGSVWTVLLLVLIGSLCFAGIGLLVASRAKTMEAVSGLMNLVMLPMWVLSGIFFSSERFPEFLHPFIKVLPLTALIDALRAVMLEGMSLIGLMPQVLLLIGWGSVTFLVALWIFRWN